MQSFSQPPATYSAGCRYTYNGDSFGKLVSQRSPLSFGKTAHSDRWPILQNLDTIAWSNQEEAARTPHRGRYLISWQCATSYSPEDHHAVEAVSLRHYPSSSLQPGLAPSDFHLFLVWRSTLEANDSLQTRRWKKHFATTWLNTQGQDFYQEGMFKLISPSNNYLIRYV